MKKEKGFRWTSTRFFFFLLLSWLGQIINGGKEKKDVEKVMVMLGKDKEIEEVRILLDLCSLSFSIELDWQKRRKV